MKVLGQDSAAATASGPVGVVDDRPALRRVTMPVRTARLRSTAGPLISAVDATVLVSIALLTPQHLVGLLTFGALAFTFLRQAGLQRPRLTLSILDDLPVLLTMLLAAVGITAALRSIVGTAEPIRDLCFWLLAASAAVVVARSCVYTIIRWARRSGRVSHPTLVIGCGLVGGQITQALLDNPQYGLRPVGFLDDEPLLSPESRPAPLLSGTEDLAYVIEEHGVHDVIVAFSSRSEIEMIDVLRTCDRMGAEIFTVPRLFEMDCAGRGSDSVRGIPLLRMRRPAFRSIEWRLKRLFDVLMSSVALVLLSPLLLVLAIATRIEGGPGIIFRQERIGIDGEGFELFKFRSLKPEDPNESATRWNVSNDHRMGRVGKTMRRLSLDELPQLWNILRGDMSIVGPRPERPFFVDQFVQEHREYLHRHRVPCGLTGWAQVNGLRGDTSIKERARFDNYYIENWTLWFDVKIILRTVTQVFRMTGG